jgi:hypothetical protein
VVSNPALERCASIIMCLNTPFCVHVSPRFFVSYCVVLYRDVFVLRHVMCCLLCFIVTCCVLLCLLLHGSMLLCVVFVVFSCVALCYVSVLLLCLLCFIVSRYVSVILLLRVVFVVFYCVALCFYVLCCVL